MKRRNGFSMVEMMMALGLTGMLALIAVNLYDFSQKETKVLSEDIINTIARFGASKTLTYDLLSGEPSFNYVNLADDNNLPFFVLAKNEFCRSSTCTRQLTLDIKPGATKSRSFYIIVKRPQGKESLKFTIDPNSVYSPSKIYAGINWQKSNPDYSITKTADRVDSPWQKGRLLMLTSEMDFYDCMSPVHSMGSTGGCKVSCENSGTCNFIVKRPYKMLGGVNTDELDMTYYPIEGAPAGLIKTAYQICRPNKEYNCAATIDLTGGLTTTRSFFDKLPYIPGNDNRATLAPVEIVQYWLERPNPTSADHLIELRRARATLVGGQIKFQKGVILMTGLQSIVFSRANISNSIIDYKLKKVRLKKSLNTK
ncbi:prepilin-type N-terminal cleavage/methylation domain-containing protein [Peredibacter starrii]|uniref:Prepilin-type N-terminal cleavage/methylation domain-containing protein n=1 Tax=Peredibacter starrii TaxID=28202 RepID=A0AAX4HJH3_9BACT|nr:prepilin-type N-terminal cleavage/methylation domain-containing protein [Peredibacter starrii]WPU63365.1 prepilin-type N-terminal cleavage/methylation domain-containing protein [Peredibacter starrii]